MFKVNTYALDQLNCFNRNEYMPTFCMLEDDADFCYLQGEIPNILIIDEEPTATIPEYAPQDNEDTIISEELSQNNEEEVVNEEEVPNVNNKKLSRGGNYSNSSNIDTNLIRINVGESIELTDDERYWLEKLVEAESADEPYDGKLAVANIIVNRLKSDLFPNNINDIITAPKQFQPFENGAIYERVASPDSISAVNEVFDNGIRVIPNDVFYFMSDTISGNWIDNTREFYKKIGSHLFFYQYEKEE